MRLALTLLAPGIEGVIHDQTMCQHFVVIGITLR